MGKLRDRMHEDLELRGFRPCTVETYLRCATKFAEHFSKSPMKMGATEIRQFLLHLLHDKKLSPSTSNVYASALGFLYEVTLKQPKKVRDLPWRKIPMRLPVVLSRTEVERLLSAIENAKHRVMVMLAYGAGLRVSEIARLEVQDSDSKGMRLHVRDAKRGRELYVMLSLT